jgi:hypothetical protein
MPYSLISRPHHAIMHQIAVTVGSLYQPSAVARDQCDFALDTLEECLTLAMRED